MVRSIAGCRVVPAGRVGAEKPDGQGLRGLLQRLGDQLEVRDVEHVPRDRHGRGHLEPDLVARLVRLAEQHPLLVVEVVRPEGLRHRVRLGLPPARVRVDIRVVGERIHAVEPRVLRRQRHRLVALAVDLDVERRTLPATGSGVGNAVAQSQRVGRPRQRELDVLPSSSQPYCGTPRSLGGQRVGLAAGPDLLAAGDGVLRLLLDEGDAGAAALDERGVEPGAGDHRCGGRRMGGRGQPGRRAERDEYRAGQGHLTDTGKTRTGHWATSPQL